jgi:hypothetical protein
MIASSTGHGHRICLNRVLSSSYDSKTRDVIRVLARMAVSYVQSPTAESISAGAASAEMLAFNDCGEVMEDSSPVANVKHAGRPHKEVYETQGDMIKAEAALIQSMKGANERVTDRSVCHVVDLALLSKSLCFKMCMYIFARLI